MKLKELLDKRKNLVGKIKSLVAKAESENRGLTDDEAGQFDQWKNEVDDLDAQIERARALESMNSRTGDLDEHASQIPGPRVSNDAGSAAGSHLSNQDRADISSFSFVRAIRRAVNQQPLDGVEAEMHAEAVKAATEQGRVVNGIGIPQIVLEMAGDPRRNQQGGGRFRNDLTATGGTGGDEGGVTVATELRPLIDYLSERLVVRSLGATFFTNLRGNISFPRAIAGTDPAHKGETAAADETSPTFDSVDLSPNRLPVFAEVSKQLLAQNSVSVEAWLRRYLAGRIAVIMDKMSINGSGSSSQPRGILNVSGIGNVETDSAADKADKPTYEDLVDLETEITKDDADVGAMAYLTTPVIKGVLKKTLEFPSAPGGAPIWKDNEINGYRAAASNVVPSDLTDGAATSLSAVIFGVWSKLMVAQWGGIDLQANPFSRDTEGIVRLVAESYYDCAVEHPQHFAAILDANTVDMA